MQRGTGHDSPPLKRMEVNFFPTTPGGAGQSAGGSAGTKLWVPALPVGRWGTFGCTAPRYRHKRRSGMLLLRQCVCVGSCLNINSLHASARVIAYNRKQ